MFQLDANHRIEVAVCAALVEEVWIGEDLDGPAFPKAAHDDRVSGARLAA